MITSFHLLAIFVEAPLLAWSERVRVGRFSAAALFTFALACFGAALADGPLLFVLALALYGPASGCALAASEGLLVETRPDERERTIARLTLAGALGDLAVPLLLGALAWLGLGWRVAMAVAGGAALLLAFVHGTSRELDRLPPKERDDDDDTRARFARPAITTPTSRHAKCGRVLPVFCAQLGALRAPAVPRSAAEAPTRPIDGRSCASTSRSLSTRGSGRSSPSRARGAFGRGRLAGVSG
jgi:MFS family permease